MTLNEPVSNFASFIKVVERWGWSLEGKSFKSTFSTSQNMHKKICKQNVFRTVVFNFCEQMTSITYPEKCFDSFSLILRTIYCIQIILRNKKIFPGILNYQNYLLFWNAATFCQAFSNASLLEVKNCLLQFP